MKEGRRDEVGDVTMRYRGGSEILQETLAALGNGASLALLREELRLLVMGLRGGSPLEAQTKETPKKRPTHTHELRAHLGLKEKAQ